ncbi:DUF871 domain-containing protein [Leptotrichia sp. OH3620_COT-345]|uniref:MupG family TIM beta-alpha barrel fold protein n=1 Tax=Leptotrichia sp. OH3620_COT-345 TaxID=2491048 RepID=UPI000F648E2B|nr:MupG family TIM beta-alpha barrel fold protein [Leptotrichia sp. OH3620_COT-345]RRD39733.1 DUF871 domain-containing protein [Leptotrichia sp. OH3620_COT-345]
MKKNFGIGFSIYLSTDIKKIENVINKAEKSGSKYVFTSLNISEEKVNKNFKLEQIVKMCTEKNLNLIVDINNVTKDNVNLNLENIYLRIDEGLTLDEILKLSEKNKIVLNASTITEEDLEYLKKNNIDFSKILSLHNFYPKKFTGISEQYLKEQNLKYKKYGIKTMAFVRGDELRGPVYEGLPTVEEHRDRRFLTSCLRLLSLCTDIILVGDIDISDEKWMELKYLNKGVIPLRSSERLFSGKIFENRIDYSEYVIRVAVSSNIGETRKDFSEYIREELKNKKIDIQKKQSENTFIKRGDVLISNEKYLRYEGELEIALKDLGIDEKRCVVSKIDEKDIELLEYVKILGKFRFYSNF